MGIIDQAKRTEYILDVEAQIEMLTLEEQSMILNDCLKRVKVEIQKTNDSDTMQRVVDSLPFNMGNILKKQAESAGGD